MRSIVTVVSVVVGLLAGGTAYADDVADFYKGKRVNLVVSYGTGGGYDVYARVLARHMGRYIPGNPNIIVQNMPGAGSLRGTNYLYNIAAKDGTVWLAYTEFVHNKDHDRLRAWGLIYSLGWLIFLGALLLVGAGMEAGNKVLVALGGLTLFVSPLPAAIGVGQAVAAIRARGDHMILATIGLALSGLNVGVFIGLFSFSIALQT